MFLRVETGIKSEFHDPYAERWLTRINKVHQTLAEKIRWIRRIEVYWIELDAPRDKVVNAIQAAFKDPVLSWLFTGDLLPSAAGPTGTLQDLMQAAPMRPGVFHGIEKRKRLQTHDEKAQITLDALQTILKRSSSLDKLVTGELLLLEGPRLTSFDLEWLSRYLFTDEKFESWSFISEEELRKNSRFQSEQVAKYLVPQHTQVSAKWLQYRQSAQKLTSNLDWKLLNEAFRKREKTSSFENVLKEEEWSVFPKIEFATMDLNRNTQNETEFALLKAQLEMNVQNCKPQLQTVMSVLPAKGRLWIGSDQGFHPERVWNEYLQGLKRIAETTSTPVMQVKAFEDDHENDPSFFWTSTVGVAEKNTNQSTKENPDMAEIIWVGQSESSGSNVIFVEKLKEAKARCEQATSLQYSVSCSGKTLQNAIQSASSYLRYGFDLVVDGHQEWFSQALSMPLPLSELWGVHLQQKEWVFHQLKIRGIPFLHIGTSNLSGDIKVLQGGQAKIECNVSQYFSQVSKYTEADLIDEPFYIQDPLKVIPTVGHKFSTEELLIKGSPVVLRPNPASWAGLMILSDLFDSSLRLEDLEWMLRKCTAMGGQVHSAQVSFVNGLKSWNQMIKSLCSDFGIQLSQVELRHEPQLQSHWCAVQFISTVVDIRTMRSNDAKNPQERIYWIDGRFDQPAFRWLAGLEGRYQAGLGSALAVDPEGVKESLVKILIRKKLGAEVRLVPKEYRGGFLVTLTENERFAIEEEWKMMGLEFDFLGKTAVSPYLVIREEGSPAQTVSIEDAKSMADQRDDLGVQL